MPAKAAAVKATEYLQREVFQRQADAPPTRLYARFLHPQDLQRLRLDDKYRKGTQEPWTGYYCDTYL